ncbi:NAD(P)-dependent alcohol dehydrogenase, partial [Paraburkholderia sp. SIMBA_030]
MGTCLAAPPHGAAAVCFAGCFPGQGAPCMSTTYAYAATDAQSPLAPFEFQRRALRDLDVQIEVLYCGVCHS